MLHRMVLHLSDKVIALHLDNSTAKTYLCYKGHTVSQCIFRLVSCILNVGDKHDISFTPVYIPTYCNLEANYLS